MSRFLDRLAAPLARLARWMNLAAGWLFVVCAVFITVEVLARNFLGFSTQSTTELSGYMLAVGIAWGLANALAERAHVRIDIVHQPAAGGAAAAPRTRSRSSSCSRSRWRWRTAPGTSPTSRSSSAPPT